MHIQILLNGKHAIYGKTVHGAKNIRDFVTMNSN